MTNLKRTLLIGVLLVSGLALRPPQAAAQVQSCYLCDSSTAWPTCNSSNGGQLHCEGVFLWFLCMGCELETRTLLPQVAPDGIIAPRDVVAGADLSAFAQRYGAALAPGDFMIRRACDGTVTHRWYIPSRESEFRDLSAVIVL